MADPSAGAGDLLMAARQVLGEHDPVMFAAEADPLLARLARRRLVVHGVSRGRWQLDIGAARQSGPVAGDAQFIQLPYQSAERRTDLDPFPELTHVATSLTPGQTAVVFGPAELLVGVLPPYKARPAPGTSC